MKFNNEQLRSVQFYKGSCGVVSAAGSGKSTVLINRIKNLVEVHNEPQHSILAVSFTRKTADELQKKLSKMGLSDVNVGTFHSICGRILVQEGVTLKLIQDWQVANYLKSVDKNVDVDDVKSFISYQKNYNKTFTDKFVPKDSSYNENELRVFFKQYETMKSKAGLCDFDDYLTLCLDILQQNKGKYTYEFILVDEHQDSGLVQNMILQELCQSGNMFCLYDPRQAIYSWRSGNVEYCMNFHKYWDNPTIINLYKNYRSTKNIVDNANKFIKPYFKNYEHYVDSEAHNQSEGNITIHTYSKRDVEGVEVADKIEELIKQGEKLSEIAVLYRMNLHSSFVENELKRRGIDYEITNDSGFFKLKEVEAILSYLRLLHNPHDDQALETVFKSRQYPLKYLKNDMLDKARQYSGLHDVSMYEAFVSMEVYEAKHKRSIREFENSINKLRLQVDREVSVITLISNIVKSFNIDGGIRDNYSNNDEINDRLNSIDVLKSFVKGNNLEQFITYVYSNNTKKKSKKESVKLMSVHSSKGLEWNSVFLIGTEDGKFPHDKSNLDEEARLFYVGITRSKKNLHISQIGLGESGKGNQFILEYFGDNE